MHRDVKIGIVAGVLILSLVGIYLMSRSDKERQDNTAGIGEDETPLGEPVAPMDVDLSGKLPDIPELDSPGDAMPATAGRQPQQAQTQPADVTSVGPIPVKTPRDTSPKPTGVATVKKHKVVKDETLWSIAEEYYNDGTKHKLISEANKAVLAQSRYLRPGMELVIPDLSRAAKPPAAAIRPKTPAGPAPAVFRTHIVVNGDTLIHLARRYYHSETKADIDRIHTANRKVIRDRDVLVVGTRLVIPPKP